MRDAILYCSRNPNESMGEAARGFAAGRTVEWLGHARFRFSIDDERYRLTLVSLGDGTWSWAVVKDEAVRREGA